MKQNNSIRRAFAAILATALLLSTGTFAFAEGDAATIHIKTAEDLLTLSENCTLDTWSQGKTIELDDDISLEGTEFKPIPSFGGTFNGNGRTISGLNIGGKVSSAGLFRTIQAGGIVRSLNVSGVINASNSEAVGGIAAVNNGTIQGCSFAGSINGSSMTGGIAGINGLSGSILSCRSMGAVYGTSMTGGIAGENLGLISASTNNAYVNTSTEDKTVSAEDISIDISFDMANIRTTDALSSATDSGGIVGYSSGTIRICENTAVIGYQHVGYNVGGIAGRSCGHIFSCANSGTIYGRKDVGGIVGQMEPYIEMTMSESTLDTLKKQLNELSELIDKAADDAEGGAGSVTGRLNKMSGYVKDAVDKADDMKLVIDADGSISGVGGSSHDTDTTVTPGSGFIAGGSVGGGSIGASKWPGGGIIGAGGGNAGGIVAGGTPGDIDISGSGSAGGVINGAAQVVATPELGGLTSAVNGIGGQLSRLNSAVTGAVGTLADDVRAINAKFGEISDTMYNAVSEAQNGDIITDTSAIDIENITLGKVAESKNSAAVNGDINVGGIAGAMAMEYTLDPEDDVSGDMSLQSRREYELKAVAYRCTNTGKINAKRSYVGGIAGRMDLGMISGCGGFGGVESENGSYVGGVAGLSGGTVSDSFAKCKLSGRNYIGGIVGSGITETLTGAASIVSGCYGMVEIQGDVQYRGAISGAMAGEYVENYFVSDDLAGIDGQSYGGKTEPISYDTLMNVSGLPNEMKSLTLSFTADEETIYEETFNYGASFDDDIYPDIPKKDGYYAQWDRNKLNTLHFDTEVKAIYTQYTTTVSADASRDDGMTVFLADGAFDEGAAVAAYTLAKSTDEFMPLSGGWTGAVQHYLSSDVWYRLISTPINRDVSEQWHITLPQDGASVHKVHYVADNGGTRNIDIYIRQDGSWQKTDCEVFGSYLVFSVIGNEADIAAVLTLPVWWAWLIAGIICLLLIALIIILICRAARKVRVDASNEKAEADATIAHKKKRRWLWIMLIGIAVIIAAAAAYMLIGGGDRLAAYYALNKLNAGLELSMNVSIDTTVGDETAHMDTVLQRKSASGQDISYTRVENVPLYYANGAVILENGKTYRIRESFPDYPAIVAQLAPLYRDLKAERDGSSWTITADGDTAKKILTAVLPEISDEMAQTQAVQVRVQLEGLSVKRISISADGTLSNGLALRVDVSMDNITTYADFDVPDAVVEAAASVSDDLPVITEDALTLFAAWQQWKQQENKATDISLNADCGPVVVEQKLKFYACQSIYCISKDTLALYWNGERTIRQDGSAASDDEQKLADMAKLMDIAYLACQDAEFTKDEQQGVTGYTIQLDSSTMHSIAAVIAPESGKLDMTLSSGSITVRIAEGRISGLSFTCEGHVKVVVLDAKAAISGNIEMSDDTLEIPVAVKAALQ